VRPLGQTLADFVRLGLRLGVLELQGVHERVEPECVCTALGHLHVGARGLGLLEPAYRTLALDLPVADDGYPVAQLLGFVHVVRGHQDEFAELVLLEDVPEFSAGGGVQPCGGFVQHHDFAVPHKADRDRHPPLETAREVDALLVDDRL